MGVGNHEGERMPLSQLQCVAGRVKEGLKGYGVDLSGSNKLP